MLRNTGRALVWGRPHEREGRDVPREGRSCIAPSDRASPLLMATTVWIVDAMNVIGTRPTGWWRDRRAAVRRLVAATARRVAVTEEPVTLVVDGRPSADLPEGETAGVRVVYAARRGADAADDRIVELVAAEPGRAGLCVVTSDRALADRVRTLGARVMSAGQWLRQLDASPAG